jgi:hypothetical protein
MNRTVKVRPSDPRIHSRFHNPAVRIEPADISHVSVLDVPAGAYDAIIEHEAWNGFEIVLETCPITGCVRSARLSRERFDD